MSRSPHRRWKPYAFLLLALLSTAARAEKYPDKWLPVTPEELALTDSAIEPGVSAEALFVKAWVKDALSKFWSSSGEHYIRMKIYTEAGAQRFAKVDIDYPLTDVSIDEIRARVIQPDGTITELDKRAVIRETRSRQGGVGTLRKSFPLAGVRPGCVVEYRYRRSAMNSEAWSQAYNFQFDYPARLVAYHVRPVGLEGIWTRQLTFHATSSPARDPDNFGFYEATSANQRAYLPEPNSPPAYSVRGWMLTYYTNEELKTPEIFWRNYGRTQWEWVNESTRPDRDVRELAQSVTGGITGDLQRVQALCEWMRLNFQLLKSAAPESLRAAGVHENKNARDALRQRAGVALNADLALIALARAAGLEARLLKVPSRERLFFDEKMMSEEFLVSFGVAIRVDGRWRAFNVATPRLPWDMIQWSEEGERSLLCDRDSSRFVFTDISEPDRSLSLVTGTLVLDQDGTLEGDLETMCTGHVNHHFREVFEDVQGEKVDSVFVEALGWNQGGAEISRVFLDRGQHDWDPLVIRWHVRIPVHASVTEKRMILEPGVLRTREPARFTAGTRRQPVYFEHAWSERDSILIKIPEGWKLESVDSPTPVRSEGVADYRTSTLVSDDGRELLYLRYFAFGYNESIYFSTDAYPAIKELFDQVRQRDLSTVTYLRDVK